MKKICVLLFISVIASGCSSTSSGAMKCTSNTQQEQMTSTVTMTFTYEDDIVLAQENETQIKTMTSDAFDQMKALVDSSSIVFQTIHGATYDYSVDEASKTINEKVTIDFTTISKEDKQKILSYEGSEEMDVNDIKETLQSQSFTCTK